MYAIALCGGVLVLLDILLNIPVQHPLLFFGAVRLDSLCNNQNSILLYFILHFEILISVKSIRNNIKRLR